MKIEELIDRYFEGQTSCEEERELRSFFTQENVPESLQVYRPCLSAWIRKQKHSGKKVLLLKSLPSAVALFTQREE